MQGSPWSPAGPRGENASGRGLPATASDSISQALACSEVEAPWGQVSQVPTAARNNQRLPVKQCQPPQGGVARAQTQVSRGSGDVLPLSLQGGAQPPALRLSA